MQHEVTTPPSGPDDRPHADPADRLLDMANQIASFFASYPHYEAVAGSPATSTSSGIPHARRFLAAAEARAGVPYSRGGCAGAVKG